jgi:hypothetical protein
MIKYDHDWLRIPGSTHSFKCTKCKTIGYINIKEYESDYDKTPKPRSLVSCETIVVQEIMEQ